LSSRPATLKGKAATDVYRAGVPLEQIQHLLGKQQAREGK
jgi:hypothetical protein